MIARQLNWLKVSYDDVCDHNRDFITITHEINHYAHIYIYTNFRPCKCNNSSLAINPSTSFEESNSNPLNVTKDNVEMNYARNIRLENIDT